SQGLRAQARRARQAVPLRSPVASRPRKAPVDTGVDINAWGALSGIPPPRDRSVDGIEIDYGPTGPAIINPWGIFAIDLSSQRFFCTGTRSSPASLVATVTWQVPAVVCQSVEGAPYLLRPSSRHDFRSNPLSPTWLWPVGVLPRDGRLFSGCDRRARSVPRPGPWLVLRRRSRDRARVLARVLVRAAGVRRARRQVAFAVARLGQHLLGRCGYRRDRGLRFVLGH